ncbi:MAG: extracellular solute-binding protein [Chloroflexota bacterium]|nr:extracellular solute-binding protein [Chloroflexota bacterium]
MAREQARSLFGHRVTRRGVIQTGAAAAGAAAVGGFGPIHGALGAAGGAAGRSGVGRNQEGSSVIFLSTQLKPIEEAEKMRTVILENFEGEVEFIPEDNGPFTDRILAEAESEEGSVGVLGGLHGDLASFAGEGLLADLSDLAGELEDRGFLTQYLELGRYGGDQLNYIPWMQATYIMAARREALDFLPEGLDEETLQSELTYDQLTEWAANIAADQGQKLGFPAGEDGLIHRFLQGYAYPSFTGGVNTTFNSDGAVAMWEWMAGAWEHTNPQSVSYSQMSEPLLSGEVWVAWDHTARLIDALRQNPDDFITFPAPRGPEGLGFMPVVAGLAIPANAPDMDASRALIEYLTRPEIQALTLREVAFFPATDSDLPTDLEAGIQAEADAVQQTTTSEDALPSLLPVGLGEESGAYNKVFRDALQSIVFDGNDIQETLDTQAANLQSVLDTAGASCWAPDPLSDGVCQVG